VGVHYHRRRAEAEEVAQGIRKAGGEAETLDFDVADAVAVERTVREFAKRHGRLDALVAAAGVVHNQMLGLTDADALDELWRVNLRGAMQTAKAASKAMLRGRWGRIVLLASVVGLRGNAGQAGYAATKAGLIGFGKSLARELAPRGVTVNIVAPGAVETGMIKDLTNEQRTAILQHIPCSAWDYGRGGRRHRFPVRRSGRIHHRRGRAGGRRFGNVIFRQARERASR
jgi:3-oxoacyl-[acyl-carrier protein] reductase